jgi:fructose-bisphosphate aldolase class I
MMACAQTLVGAGKGLLAMDESNATCNKRFAAIGIAQTEAARRDWRDLLITTPGLGECVSGAILYDETIRQKSPSGVAFPSLLADAGILPGIKVDTGAQGLAGHAGETVTEGLDGLRARLKLYFQMGARFAKWRAVIQIGDGLPTRACITANAQALARYAALCQEAGLVPIVEPEVLMTGAHDLPRCAEVTSALLRAVFDEIEAQGVVLEAMILKPNMILAGASCQARHTVEEVASATVTCLLRCVPASVAGIAFLSGGQDGALASAHLNAMNVNVHAPGARAPWPLVFSFARAIQQPALQIWHGEANNRAAAQAALYQRARNNHAALRGQYNSSMENA